MTLTKEWFIEYVEVPDSNIKMENDFVCKIPGIGLIKLMRHDGRFCTLNEVRHVPSMTKNLISMSLLDSKGFKYSGGDGVLNVYRGSDVILKGFMHGTLYLLKGSTVTGSANCALPKVHEEDMTKPSHMRFGHMIEHGMHYQTLLERARCMLSNAGLAKRFWVEAVNTTCYLINLGFHTSIECRIPSGVWLGKYADSEAEKGSTDTQVELHDDHEVVDLHKHKENQDEQAEDVQTETQSSEATRRSIAKDRPRRIDV